VIDKMWAMEADELQDHWDTVLYYFDVSGSLERYESAPPLIAAGEGPEADEAEATNVQPFPEPKRVAGE
jgi:hypothetical protein